MNRRNRPTLEEVLNETGITARAEARGEARGRVEGEARGRVEGEARGRVEGEARGRVEGEARGRTEGEARKAFSIAQNMINMGLSFETIVSATQLKPEKVKALYAK